MGNFLDAHGQPISRRLNAARLTDRVLDELIGLARGMIADGVVADSEAKFLQDWLVRNRTVADSWPACVLYERVREMLKDGVLDPQEQIELLDTLRTFVAPVPIESDEVSASTALPLDEPPPSILFQEKAFCFTGKFAHGTRDECQRAVLVRGATVQSSPTRATQYLIIGEIGSRDWVHSTYGRKIEKAVSMRSDGVPLAIVSERHWAGSF